MSLKKSTYFSTSVIELFVTAKRLGCLHGDYASLEEPRLLSDEIEFYFLRLNLAASRSVLKRIPWHMKSSSTVLKEIGYSQSQFSVYRISNSASKSLYDFTFVSNSLL